MLIFGNCDAQVNEFIFDGDITDGSFQTFLNGHNFTLIEIQTQARSLGELIYGTYSNRDLVFIP